MNRRFRALARLPGAPAGVAARPPGSGRWALRALPALAMLAFGFVASPASSQLEVHYQRGNILNPLTATSGPTSIFTLQHAGGWRAGGSFFFLDYLVDDVADGFNDRDLYGEWYPTLSLGSLARRGVGVGPVRDFRLVAGVNLGIQSKVLKYVPGVELAWEVPGFVFVNTMLGALVDASGGLESGGAPATEDGWNLDVSWLAVFQLGGQSFSFTGHAEYMSGVVNEVGEEYPGGILAQPQLRWDVGRALSDAANVLHAGVEYQLWTNKLGTTRDERTLQLLVVWQLD